MSTTKFINLLEYIVLQKSEYILNKNASFPSFQDKVSTFQHITIKQPFQFLLICTPEYFRFLLSLFLENYFSSIIIICTVQKKIGLTLHFAHITQLTQSLFPLKYFWMYQPEWQQEEHQPPAVQRDKDLWLWDNIWFKTKLLFDMHICLTLNLISTKHGLIQCIVMQITHCTPLCVTLYKLTEVGNSARILLI